MPFKILSKPEQETGKFKAQNAATLRKQASAVNNNKYIGGALVLCWCVAETIGQVGAKNVTFCFQAPDLHACHLHVFANII